jgi:hypothetical protein
MRIIARPRGAGKTSGLVKLCFKHGGSILVFNDQRKKVVEQTAKYLEIPCPDVIIYSPDFMMGYPRSHKLWIDDIDYFLEITFKLSIAAITLTSEI